MLTEKDAKYIAVVLQDHVQSLKNNFNGEKHDLRYLKQMAATKEAKQPILNNIKELEEEIDYVQALLNNITSIEQTKKERPSIKV